jgi:ethanolamine permease
MATLIVLCALTFVASVGVAGWEKVVFDASGKTSDSPLPLALQQLDLPQPPLYSLMIGFGVVGLVASFHGLLLAAGRSTYEFCRLGNGPAFLGKIHPKYHTPVNALLINMGIGLLALISQSTAEIIVLSAFGALTMYSLSLISFILLRKHEPELPRPFRTPGYPLVPWTALSIALVSLVALVVYNPASAMIFAGILGMSYGLRLLLVQ